MTITYDPTTDTITLTSSEFSSLVAGKLESGINCGDTTYELDVVPGDISGTDYTVDINALYGLSELSDGIYSFKFTTVKAGDATVVEYNCLFVDKEVACTVTKLVAQNKSLELMLNYYLLSNATNCECTCEALCALYENIISYESDNCDSC